MLYVEYYKYTALAEDECHKRGLFKNISKCTTPIYNLYYKLYIKYG